MIELVQFPWSPFCIVQRRILEYSGARFKITNISSSDRSLVWRLTRQRYYAVPILRDGKNVIFETSETTQVIAKYLNQKLELDLFPPQWAGLQFLIWSWLENEVEGVAFKLNDIYWEEFVPKADQLGFVRHKERRFGSGCLGQWRKEQDALLQTLAQRLMPFEQMLGTRPFLLDAQPRFVDFDLFGMLGNFLYSGHYQLPQLLTRLQDWHQRMCKIKAPTRS